MQDSSSVEQDIPSTASRIRAACVLTRGGRARALDRTSHFRRISFASLRSGTSTSSYNTCRGNERRATRHDSRSPTITELRSVSPPGSKTPSTLALRDADHALVGEDSRDILKDRRYRNDMDRTALIDLVIGQLPAAANDHVILDQPRRDKYALKSRLFADEVDIVLRRKGLDAIKGTNPTSTSSGLWPAHTPR